MAKRAPIAPPSTWPTSAGGDGQVRSISPLSHARKPSASSRPSTSSDVPCPGRSGAIDAVRGHQIRNHAHPHAGKVAGAMQQQDRRSCAPFQYCRRHAGHLQPPLGDRQAGQQERAMAAAAVRVGESARRGLLLPCSAVHRVLANEHRQGGSAPNIRRTTQFRWRPTNGCFYVQLIREAGVRRRTRSRPSERAGRAC